MKYKFTIEELLSKTVEIEADNIEQARSEIVKQYKNEEIVLTADDFSGIVSFELDEEMEEELEEQELDR